MDEEIKKLSEVPIGSKVIVENILSDDKSKDRLLDLGVIKGTIIEVLQKSPFGDPIAYFIKGAVIALRNEDAEKITVKIL